MKYVITKSKQISRADRLRVIQFEIDYELITLNDALKENDRIGIAKTKERLANLVYEMQSLENTVEYL